MALTKTAWAFGVMLGLMGVALFFLPDRGMTDVTRGFLGDVPQWLWALMNFSAGAAILIPGCRYRRARTIYASFICMLWVGVCLWPVFDPGGANAVSVLGIILWCNNAAFIYSDMNSPAYSRDYGADCE